MFFIFIQMKVLKLVEPATCFDVFFPEEKSLYIF